MKIVVKKGLDIPLAGRPEGSPQRLPPPNQIALNLDPFDDIRFKVHVKVGESVKIGQPVVESKACPGQMFVSPAGGVVTEIRRGLKRRLLAVIIRLNDPETFEEHGGLDHTRASREEILEFFMRSGLFPHIRLRPFDLIPDPKFFPRDIFVTAIETRPFTPSFEMQVAGHEAYFQAGLDTLAKLTSGKVHLAYSDKSVCPAFTQAGNVEKHAVVGPHPAGTSSLHIHAIAPIRKPDDYVWSLSAIDAITIGMMMLKGRYFTDRIISIAGNGVLEGKRGFFTARMGYPIKDLIASRIPNQFCRLISGDPLTGIKVEPEDFMGFSHTCFSIIPQNTQREAFHFLRLGLDKFSATRTYFTGHVKPPAEGYPFTTNQHGEERAFIDSAVYERVMPLRIPTMHLIKAILSEDFELAQQLGLLEVASEDFALPAFICPSKIEMMEIVKEGLHRYAKEMGH
jgi:Na+-transporting NADH:ubiquinone oxidoreductase subunit A